MQLYAGLAVVCGIIAPFFWTLKVVYLRYEIDRKGFNTWDVGVDHNLYLAVFQTIICATYYVEHDFVLHIFLEG